MARRGGQHLGVRVGHRVPGPRPTEHFQVVGHVPERHHLLRRDAALGAAAGQGAGLADAEPADLQQRGRAGAGEGGALAADRTGEGQEVVGGELGVVREELEYGSRGAAAVRKEFLGRGDDRARVEVEGRVARLVVDAAGALDGERGAGGGGAQRLDDGHGVVGLQGAHLDEPALAVQIDDGGAVGADRQAVAVHMVADHVHPAGRAAGDEEDLDARPLGGGEGRDRTVRDGLVVAEQGPVEIGRDQPGRGRRPPGEGGPWLLGC